jgi:hypothetical protein
MSIFSEVNEKETSTRAIEEDGALSGTIIERLLPCHIQAHEKGGAHRED